MFYSNDPVADAERYMAEQEEKLDKLPRCAGCDNPIQDDHFYLINDECICSECLESNYRKDIDDYVD